MKAAFLLTTAAWLSGGNPAPAAAAPAAPAISPAPVTIAPAVPAGPSHAIVPAPITIAPVPTGACSGPNCGTVQADCGCAEAKPSLGDRLRAMFSKPQPAADCGCAVPVHEPAPCCDTGHQPRRGGLFSRMFSKKSADCGCEATIATTTVAPHPMPSPSITTPIEMVPVAPKAEPIKKPVEDKSKPAAPGKTTLMPPAIELAPASSKEIVTETQHPFELSRRYESRVDRASDYSWITGQLFYVHADGGLWVLRYAPLSQEDLHGGGVILARNRQMDSYREGDLVTVKGEILQERASIYLGAPLYRATQIELIDRASK